MGSDVFLSPFILGIDPLTHELILRPQVNDFSFLPFTCNLLSVQRRVVFVENLSLVLRL